MSAQCFPLQKIPTGPFSLLYTNASPFLIVHLHCLRVHRLCVFVLVNLGSFAVVERASFSSSSRLCVAANSASIFSSHIRCWCSSCRTRNSIQRRSSCHCFCLSTNRFLFISLSISLVCCLRTSQAFPCPQEMWSIWLSCLSSIVSPIEWIHHDLFSISLLAKYDPITCPRFSPLIF